MATISEAHGLNTRMAPSIFEVNRYTKAIHTTTQPYKAILYAIIPRSSTTSSLQLAIDQITQWTEYNNMSLNVKKTKELRISFFKKPVQFDNLTSAGTEINIL